MSLPDVANDMPAAEHGVSNPRGYGLTKDHYTRRWVGFARITAPNSMVNKWRVQLQNMFHFIDIFLNFTYIVNVACRLINILSFYVWNRSVKPISISNIGCHVVRKAIGDELLKTYKHNPRTWYTWIHELKSQSIQSQCCQKLSVCSSPIRTVHMSSLPQDIIEEGIASLLQEDGSASLLQEDGIMAFSLSIVLIWLNL